MKYFSQSWHAGDLSDSAVESAREAYWECILELVPRLPPDVRELATSTNLHDALIRRVLFDRDRSILVVELRAGDNQNGYVDVDLRYEELSVPPIVIERLAAIADDPTSELLYDEVDERIANVYVHRLLFWPYREVELVFGRFSLLRRAVSGREIAPHFPRFIHGHVAA